MVGNHGQSGSKLMLAGSTPSPLRTALRSRFFPPLVRFMRGAAELSAEATSLRDLTGDDARQRYSEAVLPAATSAWPWWWSRTSYS